MPTSPPSTDYERDYYAWLTHNAELLREGRLGDIDAEHIAEELEDMGRASDGPSRVICAC